MEHNIENTLKCFYENYPSDKFLMENVKNYLENNGASISEAQLLLRKIVLWKLNRIIEVDDEKLKGLKSLMLNLKQDDYLQSEELKNTLFELLECRGVGLPMLSTILHFYRPDLFPIIDKRALRQLEIWRRNPDDLWLLDQIPPDLFYYKRLNSTKISTLVNVYEWYIQTCREFYDLECSGHNILFNDVDKILYQIDKDKNIPL